MLTHNTLDDFCWSVHLQEKTRNRGLWGLAFCQRPTQHLAEQKGTSSESTHSISWVNKVKWQLALAQSHSHHFWSLLVAYSIFEDSSTSNVSSYLNNGSLNPHENLPISRDLRVQSKNNFQIQLYYTVFLNHYCKKAKLLLSLTEVINFYYGKSYRNYS